MSPEQRVEPPNPCLREASQQDVRECRRRLPLPARRDLDAMHEVQIEVGVGAQGQKMIVIVGGCDGGDGDIAGSAMPQAMSSRAQRRASTAS